MPLESSNESSDKSEFINSLVFPCNDNTHIVIVAKRGRVNDWAAYIGTHSGRYVEAHRGRILQNVAAFGVKLSEEQARTWFGDIELSYRR